MLINNIDLNSLGIKLYDRIIKSNQVTTTEAWLEGDIQPTPIRQQDSFKTISLSFLILNGNEDEAFLKMSKLTQLLRKATIKFDDLDYTFDVSMTGKAEPERLKNGNFIVTYNFTSDYAKGDREIYTTNANLTNSFKLTILYYQNSTNLLATETQTIRASAFEETGNTLSSIGINADKYRPNYYMAGVATNLGGQEITYENLSGLGALIINYEPIVYNLTVNYFMDNGTGVYQDLLVVTANFTYPQLATVSSIGQIIDIRGYKPEGYLSNVSYNGPLTVEDLLAASPIYVFYEQVENDLSKNVTITYKKEDDDGSYSTIGASTVLIKQSDIVEGTVLGDLININVNRPSSSYYNEGYIDNHSANEMVVFNDIENNYEIKYSRMTNTIFVEYYIGSYPNWYRVTTNTLLTKYKESFEESFDLTDINLDLNKYHTSEYQNGQLYNAENYNSYQNIISSGVLQVYYVPIDYTIRVEFRTGDQVEEVDVVINALDFLNNPVLSDIIPIQSNRPEGYQFDELNSYNGDVTLSALTQASPITIRYEEIEAPRTFNIILKYKQELASTISTINTSIITINEADCIGGVRLKDLFNMNLYRPEYYEPGVLDGASSTALLQFDELQSSYNIVYMASTYLTPVKYYTDEVNSLNWIGSSSITYKVIDFTISTTLYDLGFNLNLYKPNYADDGILQYSGPINFASLRQLESIDVVYETVAEPEDPSGIDYPHRFLFLEHNDLGSYEALHPNWTMNHAYINTGVTVDDMSKLTVIMECARVDENVPLSNVNAGYGYLFGSRSVLGSFDMRFNNQTQYGTNLTGVNTYEAQAGLYSDRLVQSESAAIGFSANTGIYAIERSGYSTAVFTYSNTMQSESAQMPYPLYLFALNNAGSYEDGLAGIGIYSCRIYYDGVLIRDLIPVEFYDKIGDLVAPSNCLYDKISGNFFEDGTGQNSFNIRDDERYTDTNLEHKIGHCYVNYYKGETFIQTVTYYFRASDFVDSLVDPYEKFQIDNNQPSYYGAGEIQNYNSYAWTFDGMNNTVYTVVYPELGNTFMVSYYQEDALGNRTLLAEEEIGIQEKDFYQAPTFGDIVRINKYKPDGFETNFEYPGAKVSLARVLDNAPYEIIYKPANRELETYETVIRYIKKVFGIRTYETIGTVTITLDETNFRDGEYIDNYVDFNLYKPASFYGDGEPYQWYLNDERLTHPEDLKPLYIVVYNTEPQYIDINYYTDEVDPANLIASTTWEFSIDDFDPAYSIYLIDTLPNEYFNRYKPANCSGGVLQDSQVAHTFDTLVALEEIAIVYESITEPNDPSADDFEAKILYWDVGINNSDYSDYINDTATFVGGRIPYIDLGYKPKEIGRLRVEIKGYARPWGVESNITNWGYQDLGYTYYFGYYGPKPIDYIGVSPTALVDYLKDSVSANGTGEGVNISAGSSGFLGVRCRVPVASGYVYTSEGPQYIDGQRYITAGSAVGVIAGDPQLLYTGVFAGYRKGYYSTYDENYNILRSFSNYYIRRTDDERDFSPVCCWDRDSGSLSAFISSLANPYTVVIDAYNKYVGAWRESDSNDAYVSVWTENGDEKVFEDICRPKGSISVFQSTNPDTGKVNIMPFYISTFPGMSISGSMALSGAAVGNPYGAEYSPTVTTTSLVMTGVAEDGTPIYEARSTSRSIAYASFPIPVYPQMSGCAIWRIKIYDQDRLVRDLIPVAKGDQIYDYEAPENGLFDLVTEIFFSNDNKGGTYSITGYLQNTKKSYATASITINASDVLPLRVKLDPTIYGKITTNYYDYDNSFLGNQFVNVPTWFAQSNTTIEDILGFNDYKPDDFHLDGMLDLDIDPDIQYMTLRQIYEMGSMNIYYKLRTFSKTVVYYQDNVRIGSRDLFYSLEDIDNAETIDDLNIDPDLFYDPNFAHGRIIFDESILASDDIAAFIDAPSPIVVYDKLSKAEAPDIFYVEYYRGGAYDDTLITPNAESSNYLDCNLDAIVLNPNGAIKYLNHYHTALYEDESYDYFIPYQVRLLNKYIGIHRGPARRYQTLAIVAERDVYTIVEERNGWGRLREYPNGWILLNQTEPLTGPGQNPAYDIPEADTATIPFKTEIHLSKMTIDRLWCYCPEQESWIKAEDISFNQAGKLYNGLAIHAIDISEYNASKTTLGSWGISPQAYRLKFHNLAEIPASLAALQNETAANIQSGLRNMHEVDFVYNETIYSYNCYYYRYYKDNSNLLGSAAFTCSISDWNPDWDIFLATSWQRTTKIRYGYLKAHLTNSNQYDSLIVMSDINDQGDVVASYQYASEFRLKITGPTITGRNAYYYPVEDVNGENQGYIRTDSHVTIISEYGGTYETDLDPTLYRDTELALDWSYFGFDRNLFRPNGMSDGIYMWNPRTWKKDNVEFTFRELITCGTQYVFYPPFNPNTYKLWCQLNDLGDIYDGTSGSFTRARNPGIAIDLSGTYQYYEQFLDSEYPIYDIYTSGEIVKDMYCLPLKWYQGSTGSIANVNYGTRTWNSRFWLNTTQNGNNVLAQMDVLPYIQSHNTTKPHYILDDAYKEIGSPEVGDWFAWNFSNHRDSPTVVLCIGNDYLNKEERYYVLRRNKLERDGNNFDRIYDATNLTNYHLYGVSNWYNYAGRTIHPSQFNMNDNINNNTTLTNERDRRIYGVIYDNIAYENFMMIHYWVPVPRGLRYVYEGQNRQIEDNGLFDLLTGEFARSYRLVDGVFTMDIPDINLTYNFSPTKDGKDIILFRDEPISETNSFDYFDNWDFTYSNVNYFVKTNAETSTYSQPDRYSNSKRRISNGLYMPITKYTSDSAHHVNGVWYYSGDQWLEASNTNMSTSTLYPGLSYVNERRNIALVPSVNNPSNFWCHKIPSYADYATTNSEGSSGINYGSAAKVLVSYCTAYLNNNPRFYFDGSSWISFNYTDQNRTTSNTNYVAATDIFIYQYPIENVEYHIGTYTYGDRITVVQTATNDSSWCYTGQGWIKKTATNMAIVE